MSSIVERLKPYQDLTTKQRYVLDFFKELNFDSKEHIYNHKERQLCSVSSSIKKFTEPFDADKIAGFVAKKRGITKAEVLAEWDAKKVQACNKGHRVHDFGENYTKDSVPTDGYERAIMKFWDSIPDYIYPFLFELKMFSAELGIAGTADIILYNSKTDKFIIADYKTNIDLFKNYKGKKLLEPFNDLLDCPYNKYQIQLSYYQYLFEQCGFQVEERRIIWLQPDSTYKTYKTTNLIDRLI